MLISVVIPAYNVSSFIRRTLLSLLAQHDKEFEIIVVDDGSTDNTAITAREVFNENGFANWKIITQQNMGVAGARNKGLVAASGKFVYFLDGDDYADVCFLNEVESCLRSNPEVDIVCWRYQTVDENEIPNGNYNQESKPKYRSLTGAEVLNEVLIDKRLRVWTGSVLYKRDFLSRHALKYTEGCTNGEDQEFIYKALAHANRVVFTDKVLSYYVKRKGSISNSFNIRRFDVVAAMLRAGRYIEDLNRSDLRRISELILNQVLVSNYIVNYMNCLKCLRGKGYSLFSANTYLQSLIGAEYPGLKDIVNARFSKLSGDFTYDLKKLVFYLSPVSYYFLYYLQNRIRQSFGRK